MKAHLPFAQTVCLLLLMMGGTGIVSPGLLLARPAGASQLVLQAAGGYDDNATLTDDPSGSGFGLYRIGLVRWIDASDAGLTSCLYLDGAYQDYFRLSDNYTIRAGGATEWPFSDLLRPGVYYEVMVFRDTEFPGDDLTEFLFGGRL